MPDPVHFGVFDPTSEVTVTRHDLPHWFQPGVATFITFRTADSLPKSVFEQWRREEVDWIARNVPRLSQSGGPQQDHPSPIVPTLSPEQERELQKLRSRLWHHSLDECHGECLLRRPELAALVGDSLRHFAGERYDLDSFVVMPNHVHVLAQFRPGVELRKQCGEWQRFSARKINALLHRRGAFWQSEPFDHLVRTPEQFAYLQNYIAENPRKARLARGQYHYWRSS